MAKLENLALLTKRLVAVMGMTATISFAVWSQKPQTGFSDLKHRRPGSVRSQAIVAPPRQEVKRQIDNDSKEFRKNPADDDAWLRTSFINVGYVMDQTLKMGGTDYGYNSKWGAAVQVGNSYLLPKDPLFGMVKIGIDATWFDFSAVNYDDVAYDRHQLTAGMGVGASLHVAPLVNFSESLRPLRIEAYCRFVPSYSLLLRQSKEKYENENGELESGEINARGAFLPIVSCGIALDYRAVGIGYEYRFGSADYKDLVDDRGKLKYDMTSGRIYISLRL